MYEETKIKFDWKGFLIKLIIIILVVLIVIKLLPYNRNNNAKSEIFNSNLNQLKDNGNSYFNKNNLPETVGESKTITLEDLINTGKIKELVDSNGKKCDTSKSYIKSTKEQKEYEIAIHLVCGGEENTSYIYRELTVECSTTTTTTTKVVNNSVSKVKSNNGTSSSQKESYVTSQIVTTKSKKYAIVFDSNGGSDISTQYLAYNSTASIPSNPTKAGYTFQGWYLNNVKYSFNSAVTSNLILVAKWSKNDSTNLLYYTVTFNSNGGSWIASQTVNKGGYAYNPGKPSKDDSYFIGWMYNGTLFDFRTPITNNITLTALYETTYTYSMNVYSSGYGDNNNSSFTVNHTLNIPSVINKSSNYNIRIVSLNFVRSLQSYTDINYYRLNHSATFEYPSLGSEYYITPDNLAYINYARVKKASSNIYDRSITWTGNVYSECSTTCGNNYCAYGIIYQVIWQYEKID